VIAADISPKFEYVPTQLISILLFPISASSSGDAFVQPRSWLAMRPCLSSVSELRGDGCDAFSPDRRFMNDPGGRVQPASHLNDGAPMPERHGCDSQSALTEQRSRMVCYDLHVL
jgi:hypothetical protein